MKKKLLILACFVLAIGTYATVTGVQNSVLIQNVLANKGPTVAPDENGGGIYCEASMGCSGYTLSCTGQKCSITKTTISCGGKEHSC